jgi:hypothetical protein
VTDYPAVLSEAYTVARAKEISIARYGDGELKLALGRDCISQVRDDRLAAELQEVLKRPGACLPCIPNVRSGTPKQESWGRFAAPGFTKLYDLKRVYGSSFITRPDSAPWIDVPAFWEGVVDLWRDQDIVLVRGTDRSLRPAMLPEAASIEEVDCARRDAYAEIDGLEDRLKQSSKRVLLCAGPMATVLAWRLGNHGVHALDLGHVGMFMRSAGAYRYVLRDLISDDYRQQILRLRKGKPDWGSDGAKHVADVSALVDAMQPATILDYGCGGGKLREAMAPRRILEFDPGVPGKDGMPKPIELTICTDVLEHVEPDRLQAVLDHQFRITHRGAFMVIATRPAKAKLPDGRNAHLIVKPADWWSDRIKDVGWQVARSEVREGHEVKLWLTRP